MSIITDSSIRKHRETLVEKKLTADERKNLSKEDFGYIDEKGEGHYPLNDKNHLMTAIRMFNACPPKYRKDLANNIARRAKDYHVNIKSEEILSYLEERREELKESFFNLTQ